MEREWSTSDREGERGGRLRSNVGSLRRRRGLLPFSLPREILLALMGTGWARFGLVLGPLISLGQAEIAHPRRSSSGISLLAAALLFFGCASLFQVCLSFCTFYHLFVR